MISIFVSKETIQRHLWTKTLHPSPKSRCSQKCQPVKSGPGKSSYVACPR